MRDHARWFVPALLLLALALRLGFVLRLDEPVLFWDERLYDNWAKVYQGAVEWALGESPQRPRAEAFRPGLQKGEAYTAAVGLVYALAGRTPRVVFVLQCLLDTLTCYALYAVARTFAGLRAGLAALLLAALYEPSVFAAARLQTETFTVCACAVAVWALSVPRRQRRGHFVAGAAAAVAMLARPVLQWLFPVLVPAVLARDWHLARRERALLLVLFAGGFFAVVGPRVAATTAILGTPMIAGSLRGGPDLYAGAMLENAGWKTDRLSFANPPREELQAVIAERGRSRDRSEVFQTAALRTWFLHPLSSAAVALHKLYVAWGYPYNDAAWSYLTADSGALWHQLIIALGLIGLPFAARRGRAAAPLLTATLYLWFGYLLTKIEARYAYPAITLTIACAGIAAGDLSRGAERAWRAGARPTLAASAVALLLAAVGAAVSVDRLLATFPLTAAGAERVRVAVIVAAIVCLAALAAALGADRRRDRAWLLLVPPAAIAALVVVAGRPLAHVWQEWQAVLVPNHGRVRQEFLLPGGIARPRAAAVKLDLLPQGTGAHDVVVRVNGIEVRRFRGGLTREDAELPRQESYESVFVARRRTAAPDKAWYVVDLDPASIVPGQALSVEIALEDGDGTDAALVVFGDYQSADAVYTGPSLFSPQVNGDTSIFRYLALGDFRMRRPLRPSGATRSAFNDGAGWSEGDLSGAPGRQQGRYRIFLLLEYADGTAVL